MQTILSKSNFLSHSNKKKDVKYNKYNNLLYLKQIMIWNSFVVEQVVLYFYSNC